MGCSASETLRWSVVVDTQDELAAVAAGKEPVKQGCTDAADVQIPSRTRSKTGTNHERKPHAERW
jgi:hypothetical protein